MRRSSLFVSSFLLQILLLSCNFFTPTQSSNDLVDQICKQTPYYDLCISVLRSNPSAPGSDTKGLALIMVNNILANATDTLSYIEKLIKQTPNVSLEKKLALCAEYYTPLVHYILPQADDAISQGHFGFASYNILYVKKEVNACNNKFSGSTQSPIRGRNDIIQKLLDVAAAIVKQLLNG